MVDQWPLTGRSEALQAIVDRLKGPERGVVVGGSAGVGKTRLTAEAADALSAQGWTIRRLACTATNRSVPLGAFAQWVDGRGGTAVAVAHRLIEAMAAETDGRLLLLVDDVHLIDEMSALVVHQAIVRDLGKVLATVRTGEPVLDAVLTPWRDGLLWWLELPALTRAESGQLLDVALPGTLAHGDTDRLWELTGGNVLLLRHLVVHEQASGRLVCEHGAWRWTGTPTVTPSLHRLLEHQIGAVPPAVRDVVDMVAVAEPIDRRCLSTLIDPLAVDEAERLNLVRTDAHTVRIGHPLYAEVRLAQLGPSRLRRLRSRAATALRVFSHGLDPIRLGLLWMESDLNPDPDLLVEAARVATARQDAELAQRLARAAVEAGGGTKAKLQYAYALCQLGRGEDAQAVLDLIDPIDVPGADFVNDVILRATTLSGPLRRPQDAWRIIDDALAEASGSRMHQLRTYRAVQTLMAGRPADAVAVMDTVDFSRLDPFGQIIGLSAQIAAFGEIGRPGAAATVAEDGRRLLDGVAGEVHQATAFGEFHASALLLAGHVKEAVKVANGYLRYSAESSGLPRSMALAAVGMAALGSGDLTTAARHLDPVALGFTPADDAAGLTYRYWVMYAETLARSGDVDAAVAAIERARSLRHPNWVYVEPAFLVAQAWVAASQGQVSSARELSGRAAAAARANGQWAREVLALQCSVQFGENATTVDRLDDLCVVVEGPRAATAARYARALSDRDAATLGELSHDFESMGDLLAAADAAGQASALHSGKGRPSAALSEGGRAQHLALICGGAMSPVIAAARVVLPITAREREVATLVAQGLSNREIADAMNISVRTVESHVQRACSKTGVSNRVKLAELVMPSAGRPAAS